MAPRDIRPGADWQAEIVNAIRASRAVVLVFSTNANASHEVPREISLATKHGLSVITFRIEDVAPIGSLDYALNSVHWLDAMTPPLDAHIQRLSDALRTLLNLAHSFKHALKKRPGQEITPRSSRLRWLRLAMLVPAFAATALPMALANGSGICQGCPNDNLHHLSAGLFGILLATLLSYSWAERLIVGALSIVVYFGAYVLAIAAGGLWSWFQFIPSAVMGALAMTLVIAFWNRGFLRGWLIAALAGLPSGLVFYLMSDDSYAAFAAWHVIVGCTIVDFGRQRQLVPARLRLQTLRSAASVALAALLWTPVIGVSWTYFFPFQHSPGEMATNSKDGAAYRWIPAGTFFMGCSSNDDDCLDDEAIRRHVTLTKGFWLAEAEVTLGAWRQVMTAVPPRATFNWRRDNVDESVMPVINISWEDASDYCARIDGRLPTEAEWEYAARASEDQSRYGRLNDIAWHLGNSGVKRFEAVEIQPTRMAGLLRENQNGPHQTKSKGESNGWNLYDTLGNVAEWVADDYGDETYRGSYSVVDPMHRTGSSLNRRKVVRGGSWLSPARAIRVSARGWRESSYKGHDVGVRCVWNADESTTPAD
jgi:formylglycine-generating enzyme required for sulfatase activity